MFKKINAFLEAELGTNNFEDVMTSSPDPRIKKMLRTIAILRFILFPISLCIYILGMTIEGIKFILVLLNNMLKVLFEHTHDSVWLDIENFGISHEELEKEINTILEKRKANKISGRVPKADD